MFVQIHVETFRRGGLALAHDFIIYIQPFLSERAAYGVESLNKEVVRQTAGILYFDFRHRSAVDVKFVVGGNRIVDRVTGVVDKLYKYTVVRRKFIVVCKYYRLGILSVAAVYVRVDQRLRLIGEIHGFFGQFERLIFAVRAVNRHARHKFGVRAVTCDFYGKRISVFDEFRRRVEDCGVPLALG